MPNFHTLSSSEADFFLIFSRKYIDIKEKRIHNPSDLEPQKEKKDLTRNLTTAGLVCGLSKILGIARELIIFSVYSKEICDSHLAGSRIPSTMRRILGEGAIEMGAVPSLVCIETKKDRMQWIRISQELLLYMVLTVSSICALIIGEINISPRFADILITNIPSVSIYLICAFWVSICHFSGKFLLPGLGQSISNISICSLIMLGLIFESHYCLCISAICSASGFLIWNIYSIKIFNRTSQNSFTDRMIYLFNSYFLPTILSFCGLMICFVIFLSKDNFWIFSKILFSSVCVFFASLIGMITLVSVTAKDSDDSCIMSIKISPLLVSHFTLILLILFEKFSFFNHSIMETLVSYCMIVVSSIIFFDLLNGKIKTGFYKVIIDNVDKDTLGHIKSFGSFFASGFCFFTIFFPLKGIKITLLLLPLIHQFSKTYYVYLYDQKTPEVIRKAGSGFVSMVSACVVGSLSIQFNSISSFLIYPMLQTGYISCSGLVDRIIQGPLAIVNYSFSATILPRMSAMIKAGNAHEAQKLYNKIITNVGIVCLIIYVGTILFCDTVCCKMLVSSKRSLEDVIIISKMLKLEIAFLPVFVLNRIVSVVCYSDLMHASVMKASWICAFTCVAGKFAMVRRFPDWICLSVPPVVGITLSFLAMIYLCQSCCIDFLDPIKKLFRCKDQLKSVE